MSEKGECPGGIRPGELSGYRLACFLSQSNAFFGERFGSPYGMDRPSVVCDVVAPYPNFLWTPAQRKRVSMLYFANVFYLFFMAALFSGPG